VTLRYDPALLELRIDDDGRGFDPAKAPGPKEGHFGLESTRLRMKWLGGSVEIDSAPGRGTHVVCTVPKATALAADPPLERDPKSPDGSAASPA
jgi:signal transduction histidine kinase